MSSSPVIEVRELSKSFPRVQALKGISLEVGPGEIFGLIGPDGAGKSTLFRILTTLLLPDEGTARILGMDLVRDFRKIRSLIGYMPGKFSLYQDLTVSENLEFYATIFGTTIKKNYDLIRDIYVQLEPFGDRPAGKLSGGMKQKLALCCSLIHQPAVLFLDEPTTGVDPVSRKEFWTMLRNLRERGIGILVSTPYMDEAARCDRITLVQEGRLLTTASPQSIGELYQGKLLALKSSRMFALLQSLRSHEGIASCYAFGEYLNATLDEGRNDWSTLRQDLLEEGFGDIEIREISPGIENVFMQLLSQNT